MTIEGISARVLVAGARRKDTYPWSVPAKFYSQSMKERFPKMKKRRKSKSWNTLAEGVGSNTLLTGTAHMLLNHP